jgi:GNAT superfamily N-acetyltransferase
MEYQIRPVRQDDLDELLVLMQEHADYERAGFSPSGKKEKLGVALFGGPPRLHCRVVETKNGLTGYVSYTFDYSTWDAAEFMYMDCLFLREEVRGLGIGPEILWLLRVEAGKHNCINIQWQTPAFNEPAIRFYHRNLATSKEKVRFVLAL